MSEVRNRMSGGRAVAALALALAGMGTVNVFFHVEPPDDFDPVVPVYAAAALVGLIAGWTHLGPALGRSFMHSALMAIGAACFGLVYGLALMAAKMTASVYGFSSFGTVMDLFNFLLMRMQAYFLLFLRPGPVISLVAGAVIAGLVAEHFQRRWR